MNEERPAEYRLETLGGFRVLGPKGPVEIRGKKLRALLAYLACHGGEPRSRAQSMTLLWSSYFETQARQNLRAAVRRLRQIFGTDAVVSKNDQLSFSAGLIACDVWRFETLADQDDPAALREAAGLYRGDFLAGLEIAEPAWEVWLRSRRQRLRFLAVEVSLTLGEASLSEGRFDVALSAGIRVTAYDEFREDGHRLVMRALDKLDRKAEALRGYNALREHLKTELGIEPSEETTKLAAALRPTVVSAPTGSAKPALAVLPFADLSDESEQAQFCDGVTEDIITELSRFRDLSVTDRGSSFAFKGDRIALVQVRQTLRVDYVIRGSARRYGQRVRIAVQLVDAETGSQIWGERYDRDIEDIFAVQDDLVRTIAAPLVGWLERRGRERARRKPTTSLKAYDCVIEGRARFLRMLPAENRRARAFFEQALGLDADYAAARAWLAETHLGDWAGGWTRAPRQSLSRGRVLASKAVDLDDTDSRTHTALARASCWYREFERARHHLDRALALNPSDTWALASSARCFILDGRPDKGLQQIEEAVRLNPLGRYGYQLGIAYYTMGRYGEAVGVLKPVKDPIDLVHAWLAASLARVGRSEEATRAAAAFRSASDRRNREIGVKLPKRTATFLAERYPFRRNEDLAHFLGGLELAGIGD